MSSLVKMYYEVHGEGDPLLCLHGFGASLYSWRNFVAAGSPLVANYKVITIDLKGCGKSPKPNDTRYSPLDHGDLLYRFILEHDLRKLTLIGNSFGGGLSLLLAIMLMENGELARLRSLILIDSAAYKEYNPLYLRVLSVPIINLIAYLIPSRSAAKKVLRNCYYDRNKITQEQITAYAAPLSKPGARHALLEMGKQLIPPNFEEFAAKYKTIMTPTLIIWGKQDGILPLVGGERLHQDIQNSTLKVIDQCGHIPQEERPEITIPAVAAFLQQVYGS
ncbi:MAG TPA: alpha/beta hydrolase [Pyrinomonadaceae bacterium]|nr:alpha/beta hydrolase [Pyrinomonadaceae bacterium]